MATAPNYDQIYQDSLAKATAAAQPLISSLQAQTPTINSAYDANVGNINTQQQQQVGETQTDLTREFGRRGILPDSGLFDQSLNEKLTPIRQYYTGQLQTAASSRDQQLAQLASQIAAAQGNVGQTATGDATNLFNTLYGGYQDEQNRNTSLSAAKISAATPGFNTAASPNISSLIKAIAPDLIGGGGKGPADQYVDSNEVNLAYRYLVGQGLSDSDAQSVIKAAMSQLQVGGNALQSYSPGGNTGGGAW